MLWVAPPPPDEERVSKQGPTALTQLAEFQLIRLLGQGAMGQVFRARDTFLDRVVATKLLLTTESTPERSHALSRG